MVRAYEVTALDTKPVALAAALSAGVFLVPLRAISRHVDELGSITRTAVGGYLVLYWLQGCWPGHDTTCGGWGSGQRSTARAHRAVAALAVAPVK